MITSPDHQSVNMYKGMSILDASNAGKIPHAQICRGKGRCTTCRVLIAEGLENLPAPHEDEQHILRLGNAPSNVRLACQAKPIGKCRVAPLFPPDIALIDGIKRKQQFISHEKELAILFADIRGFTSHSEDRLPFDVVSLLNQYFRLAGSVIEQHNGYLDKFIGDGIALFTCIEQGDKKYGFMKFPQKGDDSMKPCSEDLR